MMPAAPIRKRSDSDDEVGPAPAFTITTMSGRGVKISGAAIDRASQLFDYELPEGFCEGFSFAGLSIGDAADNDEAPDEAEIEALGEAEILVSTPSVADRHLPPPPRAARAHDEAETLVSTLKTSLAAKDDVAKSLARVRNILQDATDAPTGLLERGVAAGIVSVMQRFAHSNDVLIEACGTIDDLAVFDEAHEFLADAGVAGAICRIVSCLAVTVQDVDASPENEKHDELLSAALSVAGVIAQGVFEDAPFELAARACATILERLGRVASRARVVVRTLRTLDRLVEHQPEQHLRAFEGGGGIGALKSMIDEEPSGDIRVALREFVETAIAAVSTEAATDDEMTYGPSEMTYDHLLALLGG